MGNARDVVVDIIGRDKTGPAARSAAGNFEKVKGSADKLKEGFTKGAAAVAALAGGIALASKVMHDGLGAGLVKANAQVALGSKGFADLSAAAKTSAHNLGLTTTEFLNSAGQAALLAKNMNFGQDTAVQFGKMLPDLANRLSVLSSGTRSAAESSDMLRSALAGEFDPLQAVGINISANIVAQKALAMQQKSGMRLTTQQANALAVLAIVQEQTAQATDVMATAQGKAYMEAQKNTAALKEQWGALETQVTPALTKATMVGADWIEVLGSTKKMHELITGQGEFADKLKKQAKGLTDEASAVQQSVDKMAKAADGGAGDVYALARALDYARDSAQKAATGMLGDRDAQRAFKQAVADAKAALAENGKTLNINTEAGRKNQAALDGIAASANKQAAAILDAGGTQTDYNARIESGRRQLEEMARKFGMSRDAAHLYAMEVLAIPSNVSTKIAMNIETRVDGTKVSLGYFDRVLNAPAAGPRKAFGGGTTFVPFASDSLGGGRTQAPTPVNVTSNVMLDGAPFWSYTHAAVAGESGRQAFRARVGRR